tara:strand:- start:184 stop:525 length:342 start_codon:yes stop_codon:yes gene_type:complete
MQDFINYEQFLSVDIRIGTIIKAEINNNLKKKSIVMLIDFGSEFGIKKSSAQISSNYSPDKIIDKQIAAVVNFKPMQIGNLISEVLVLGFPDDNQDPILFSPDKKVKNGVKLF